MRLAEHFAVGAVGGSALAPGGHMVGVHIGKLPDLILVCIVGYSTIWAVGKFLGLHSSAFGKQPFPSFSKNSYIQ